MLYLVFGYLVSLDQFLGNRQFVMTTYTPKELPRRSQIAVTRTRTFSDTEDGVNEFLAFLSTEHNCKITRFGNQVAIIDVNGQLHPEMIDLDAITKTRAHYLRLAASRLVKAGFNVGKLGIHAVIAQTPKVGQ